VKNYCSNKTNMIPYNLKWMGLCVGIGLIASLLRFPMAVALEAFIAVDFVSSKDKK
jgi:hypothetical protein